MNILEAIAPEELAAARLLFREYETDIGVSLCFQGFEQELATLPGMYGPPRGRLLLAQDGESWAGCIALRPLERSVCEMKRLYVRPAHRGHGVGRRLAERLIEQARQIGYKRMMLDTLDRMMAARTLYTSLGFVETSPYNEHPLPGTHWMELRL